MEDYDLFKEIGIEFPRDFVFTKEDWKDFFVTLSKFKFRTLKRHGIDNRDIITGTGRVIPYRKSERGS